MTRSKAEKLNAEGNELSERGDHDAALLAYEKAAALDPTWATPWFNIGLQHKRRRQWEASLGGNAEDWTRNTRVLCKACSEGRPDHDAGHNHEAGTREPSAAHRIAIAAKSREHAAEILLAWEAEVKGIVVEWLDDGYATDSSI